MEKTEIYKNLVAILDEAFEIEPESIQMESNLYEDLELDSIDAIDLVVKIQDATGKKVKPEDFKSARTVADVVDIVAKLAAD
ncbi:acyl carrier protein [Halioxenophilus sp. WMMB6]|uniref:acyl carrier protein n=1 Tax=Halioxenophilus sp. WMMB6 TaxID=3073815 RepID=UPI00295F222B|nr:acyl carrier protein [Halioxenophilus sp. WMMB6]